MKKKYPLTDFVLDYYEMEFSDFKRKFEHLLHCKLNESGYIVGNDKLMSIRDLSYFANKEKKFAKELSEGRERGTWVNTTHQNVEIDTSQTDVVIEFINQSIEYEELKSSDIVMLKYLKKIDKQSFSICVLNDNVIKPSWRLTFNAEYSVGVNQKITFAFGRDFNGTITKSGNLIAAINFIRGFGSTKKTTQ